MIEKYLNDKTEHNFKAIHDVIVDNYTGYLSECEHLGAELKKREGELGWVNYELSERNAEIGRQKQEISELAQRIEGLQNELAERRRDVEELNNKVSERERKIAEMDGEIGELNVKIEQKDRAISYYEDGKLYRAAKKMYGLYFKVRPGKNERE